MKANYHQLKKISRTSLLTFYPLSFPHLDFKTQQQQCTKLYLQCVTPTTTIYRGACNIINEILEKFMKAPTFFNLFISYHKPFLLIYMHLVLVQPVLFHFPHICPIFRVSRKIFGFNMHTFINISVSARGKTGQALCSGDPTFGMTSPTEFACPSFPRTKFLLFSNILSLLLSTSPAAGEVKFCCA